MCRINTKYFPCFIIHRVVSTLQTASSVQTLPIWRGEHAICQDFLKNKKSNFALCVFFSAVTAGVVLLVMALVAFLIAEAGDIRLFINI